jgi:simple sugar transport system substrate-binding protein/ribose transport system substrate-binding protein
MVLHARIAVLCLAAALLAGGCGQKQEGEQKKRIAGIVFQEDQFFRLVLFGMRDAARAQGVELLEANSAGKPDREIQLVNTYIANKVDAIVISPLSRVASVSALARARDRNIAVVTFNTTIAEDFPVSFVESDQTDLGSSTGKAARAYIEQHLGGKAQIAILAFSSLAPEESAQRTNGFKQEIARLPGVQIVSEQDAWLSEQAVKKVGDILTANPGVNVIWSANEGGTMGAVMAVKNSGKAGKIVVFGTDTDMQLANFLLADDNILQAVTGQQPYEIGTLAIEAAVKALKGEQVQKQQRLPGVLLTRERPDEVQAFKQRLSTLTQ